MGILESIHTKLDYLIRETDIKYIIEDFILELNITIPPDEPILGLTSREYVITITTELKNGNLKDYEFQLPKNLSEIGLTYVNDYLVNRLVFKR